MAEKLLGDTRVALIIGASSGIGAALTELMATTGYKVAVLARSEQKLRALAEKCNEKAGKEVVFPYIHDVINTDDVPELFRRICDDMKGLDVVVYSSGVMPEVGADEFSFDKDKSMIDVNVTGAISWLNQAASRFSQLGAGSIVGIGSVAGDRGRRPAPVYCATKACLETYLEALRNRLGVKGVSVVTIKPGPVETPMTAGRPAPFIIPVEQAAAQILKAIELRKNVAYVPGKWRAIMFIIRNIPSIIFRRLSF